jgi:hypothetical protein
LAFGGDRLAFNVIENPVPRPWSHRGHSPPPEVLAPFHAMKGRIINPDAGRDGRSE